MQKNWSDTLSGQTNKQTGERWQKLSQSKQIIYTIFWLDNFFGLRGRKKSLFSFVISGVNILPDDDAVDIRNEINDYDISDAR